MSYEKEYRHCLENTNKRELVEGKSYFNTGLFAIRVKEIYEILKEVE